MLVSLFGRRIIARCGLYSPMDTRRSTECVSTAGCTCLTIPSLNNDKPPHPLIINTLGVISLSLHNADSIRIRAHVGIKRNMRNSHILGGPRTLLKWFGVFTLGGAFNITGKGLFIIVTIAERGVHLTHIILL